ncbi:MAG: efflux RND transporter periplasmic adaptor subunit [Gammaproteobacteria bacterium]
MKPILLFAVVGTMATALHAFAQQPAPASAVVIGLVEEANVTPTMPIAGTVFSRNDLQITAGVDGRLEFVAEPGTVVAAGDAVANIDVRPLTLQRAEQQAQGERARSQLAYLNGQVNRQRDLTSVSATAREQTVSDRDVAASDLKIAQLRIEQIDEQLERATITAPFDGVIAARERRGGEDVARGTLLARLVDLNTLEVRVMVPLRFSGRVGVGDTLRLFGYENESTGRVRAIVPTLDARAQTFELRVDPVETTSSTLTIGSLVSVAVPMRTPAASLVVPRDALILRRDGAFVFRVNGDNTADRIAVETGDSLGEKVAISGSLVAGDRVVVRGAETLQDGGEVAIIDADQSAGGASVSHSN